MDGNWNAAANLKEADEMAVKVDVAVIVAVPVVLLVVMVHVYVMVYVIMKERYQAGDGGTDGEIMKERYQAGDCGTDGESKFVLRMVRLKNFVKFHQEQKLAFKENGAYFLIGANQSGKSSVLEAIRRCLSIKSNTSISSAANSEENSIVVCKYEDITENASSLQKPILYTFFMRGLLNKNFKGCVLLKDAKPIIGLDRVEDNKDELLCKDISPKSHQVHEIENIFTREAMEKDQNLLKKVIKWVNKYYNSSSICETSNYSSLSTCEMILQQHLDKVVFTLPMRAIGPLQWSKSSRLKNKSDNYSVASDNAEIIKWYLENLENGKVDENVKKKEQCIFKFITNEEGGQFSLKREKRSKYIMVNDKMPILKQSEGFIEAKICSILLAEKKFTTIGLEDPGTGMHIQMIERLRDVLTSMVKDRVVIISTHCPNFIHPRLLGNIFFLARNDQGMCEITTGESILACNELMAAVPGSISHDAFATLCFIERPIFVEGESDVLFMEAFMKAIKASEGEAPLCSPHFFSMYGKDKAQHFVRYCKILHKKYYLMLDMDPTGVVQTALESSIDGKLVFFLTFDSIENVFLEDTGILGILKENKTKLSKSMVEILKKCFPNKVTISRKNEIKNLEKPKDFKLFLHGSDTFDDRVELFQIIMCDPNISTVLQDCVGRNDLVKLRAFMLRYQNKSHRK